MQPCTHDHYITASCEVSLDVYMGDCGWVWMSVSVWMSGLFKPADGMDFNMFLCL